MSNLLELSARCFREAAYHDQDDEFPASKAELRQLSIRAARAFRDLGEELKKEWASKSEAP